MKIRTLNYHERRWNWASLGVAGAGIGLGILVGTVYEVGAWPVLILLFASAAVASRGLYTVE